MIKWLKRALALLMFVCVLAFLAVAPPYLHKALERNPYEEWLQGEKEPYTGVLTLWHVVEFKPYRGSLATLLKAWTKQLEEQHYGVFLQVLSMNGQEAAARLEWGETPDILSFPAGYCDGEELLPLEEQPPSCLGGMERLGNGLAWPYAMSGYCLLLRTEFLQERDVAMPEALEPGALSQMQNALSYERGRKKTPVAGLAGDAVAAYAAGAGEPVAAAEDFLNGRAAMLAGDLRAAGDLSRQVEQGKGFSFTALPLTNYTPLVQYLGVYGSIAPEKLPYAMELLRFVLEEPQQAALLELGLLPVRSLAEPPPVSGLVQTMMEMLAQPAAPQPFLYHRYRDALYQEAQTALAGGSAEPVQARLKELVTQGKIQ